MQSYRRKCRKFRFVNSAPAERGMRTAAGVFVPDGRHLFLHRLSGVLEPRRRVRPVRAESFSLNLSGEFFAEPQRRVALCGARESAAPAAGAKRKGHLRFPFLFELLPFPCFLIWRRFPICDRFEKEYGSRVTSAFVSQHIRSSQTAYCYTYGLLSAGAAQGELPEGPEKVPWGMTSAHCF